MRTLTRTLIYRRRCPNRPWKTAAMVVWKGQQVSEFGYWNFGEVGQAECTACGGTHSLLWCHKGREPGQDIDSAYADVLLVPSR